MKTSILFFPLLIILLACSVDTQIQFEKRIIGNWWRCKYYSDGHIAYDHKNVSESNDILTFDGKIFNEYYKWDSAYTELLTWTYYFNDNYLIRNNILGTSGVGEISYRNDTLVISRYANNANEDLCFLKYSDEIPPISWPQNVVIDTIK